MFQRFFSTSLSLFFLTIFWIPATVSFAQDTGSGSMEIEITNPLQATPQQYEVLGLEVTGASTVRPEFIANTSGLTEGTTITIPGDNISGAIERLNQTGLFSDIKVNQLGIQQGGIYLEISVVEQPRLAEYRIRGVKRSQVNDLRDRISLPAGFAVTNSTTAQAINTIENYFSEEGYWNTSVQTSVVITDTLQNRATLYFDIDPGDRLEIKDIRFVGNDSFSEGKLIRELDSIKEDRWWKFFSKKLFTQEDYNEALNNLNTFYSENGFRDFRVLEDSVFTYNFREGKEGVGIEIVIEEGPQYRVRNVTWEGNTIYTDQQLSTALDFEKGDIFNSTKFQEKTQFSQDDSDITGLYHNIGYLFFEFTPDIQVVPGDSLDIHMDIVEGEIATIDEVTFSGNTKTHDDVVRRTLRTLPGQTYSRQAVVRTIRELGTLGYFEQQSINPVFVPDPQNNTVDINYELEEAQSTDTFEFSGGYGGQGIGLIISARVNFNNFSIQKALRGEFNPIPAGDGQKLSLGAQVTGSGYRSYSFGFQEPWLAGRPLSLGVNLSYNLIRYSNSNERNELFSSSVSLGRRLKWPDDYFTQSTSLSYQVYDVEGGASFLPEGVSNILSLTQVIERNSVINPISPIGGSRLRLSLEIAPPLPRFSQFYKIKTLYQNHITVAGNLVFSHGVEYGYLGYLIEGRRSGFQRFIMGGTPLQQRQSFVNDNIDLRGFPGGSSGSIAPRVNGQQVGGRLYSKYSFELRYPAIQEQQLQMIPYLFADAGNTFLDAKEFSPFNVKRAVGFGTRLFLPILGLLDLSYGYRLDGIPGTNVEAGQWELLFNIGAPF